MPQGTLFELLDKQCGGPRSSDGGGGERMRSAMAAVVVTRAETDGGSARLWPSPRGSGDDGPPPRRSKGGRPSTMTTMTTTTLTATTTISMMMAQTWRPWWPWQRRWRSGRWWPGWRQRSMVSSGGDRSGVSGLGFRFSFFFISTDGDLSARTRTEKWRFLLKPGCRWVEGPHVKIYFGGEHRCLHRTVGAIQVGFIASRRKPCWV